MKRELQKDVPDMERIEDSMSRTFASRRQWVAAEHPSVQDILRRYPALERTEEVSGLFQLAVPFSVIIIPDMYGDWS